MTHLSENMQATRPKSVRKDAVHIPYSFEADGSGGVSLERFDYPFSKLTVDGAHQLTITFDWELPLDVCVAPRATSGGAVQYNASGNTISLDFGGADAGDSYDVLVSMSLDGKQYIGTDLATGLAKYEDAVSHMFAITDENRALAQVMGGFGVSGGDLVELNYSRGFAVTDLTGGVYRVDVGRFDDQKCSCVVTSSTGPAQVTYSGDEGYFDVDLGSSPTEASVSFIFSAVV